MISSNKEYGVYFFKNFDNKSPVLDFIDRLNKKEQAKITKYIEFLRQHCGILDEPYSKHIKGKIRELRVDFSSNKYRIFYFTFVEQNIILLHAFSKKTDKTPLSEIKIAEENYNCVLNNPKIYEKNYK